MTLVTEVWGAIAAGLSAVATFLAVLVTWRAPLAAAQLAERLWRDAERDERGRAQKQQIFSTLMQERALIYSEAGVRALNLIDVVFNDSPAVREAWAELFHAYNPQHQVPQHAQEERLRKLLAAIAQDTGLGNRFSADDFTRVYQPVVLAQDRFIQDMERREKLARLLAPTQPATNVATPQSSVWPPSPTPTPTPR